MSSTALYRKYRSKDFSEVVGQEHITTVLQKSIKANKVAHAYLFTGPRGVGKTSVARILARTINGIADDVVDRIDIIEIDAASNRRIDEIRDLREKVYVSPAEAKYKVYIIDEVHMLTTEAFNALLKTLEEPPEHCVFVLATTEAHKLPETIISRTQRHNFQLVDSAAVKGHLKNIAKKEKIQIADEALDLVAEQSGGSLRDALSLLGQFSSADKEITAQDATAVLGLASHEIIDQIIASLAEKDKKKLLKTLDQTKKLGVSSASLINQLVHSLLSSARSEDANQEYLELANDLLDSLNSQHSDTKLEIALLKRVGSQAPDNQDSFNLVASKLKSAPTQSQNSTITSPEKAVAKPETKSVDEVPPVEVHQSFETNAPQLPAEPQAPVAESRPAQENPVSSSEISSSPVDAAKVDPQNLESILSEIKSNNSALYGLMRKARISIASDTAMLEFDFAFHGRRAGDSKNKQLILNAIRKNYGSISKIDIKVNKIAEKTEVKEDMVKDPAKGIIDTFGGGEVINYG